MDTKENHFGSGRENCTPGSVRGLSGDLQSYRNLMCWHRFGQSADKSAHSREVLKHCQRSALRLLLYGRWLERRLSVPGMRG
jgi:hypothetical protein